MRIYKFLTPNEVARWRDLGLLRSEDIIDDTWLDMAQIKFVARMNFAWHHANQKVKHISPQNADTYWCRVYDETMALTFDELFELALKCDYDVLGRQNAELLTNFYERKAKLNGEV